MSVIQPGPLRGAIQPVPGEPAPRKARTPQDRPLPDWPRGLREPLAAAYVGLSMTTMRVELMADRFPKPVCLTPGRQVWLREHLDRWLDQKAALGTEANPWDAAM